MQEAISAPRNWLQDQAPVCGCKVGQFKMNIVSFSETTAQLENTSAVILLSVSRCAVGVAERTIKRCERTKYFTYILMCKQFMNCKSLKNGVKHVL